MEDRLHVDFPKDGLENGETFNYVEGWIDSGPFKGSKFGLEFWTAGGDEIDGFTIKVDSQDGMVKHPIGPGEFRAILNKISKSYTAVVPKHSKATGAYKTMVDKAAERRKAIVKMQKEGKTYQEIGRAFNISKSRVGVLLDVARRRGEG